MKWYKGELLDLAKDLGYRLLPAFNTTTGIPYGRVNLKHGIRHNTMERDTCTACAGTIILEMAALSRLTGEPIFEVSNFEKKGKMRTRVRDYLRINIYISANRKKLIRRWTNCGIYGIVLRI